MVNIEEELRALLAEEEKLKEEVERLEKKKKRLEKEKKRQEYMMPCPICGEEMEYDLDGPFCPTEFCLYKGTFSIEAHNAICKVLAAAESLDKVVIKKAISSLGLYLRPRPNYVLVPYWPELDELRKEVYSLNEVRSKYRNSRKEVE
jgi:hypothetical protein